MEQRLALTPSVASSKTLTPRIRLVARRHARRTTEAPPRRWSRQGRISGHPWRPKLTNSTAPMAAERQSFLHDLPHAATFDHRMIRRTARRTTAAVQVRIDRVAPARKVRASNIGAVTETGSIELRAWHVVRVLSAPPRSRPQIEISRDWPQSLHLAGLRAAALSLQRTKLD